MVTLTNGTKKWQVALHRIIALAFLGKCPVNHSVHHINHIRDDNRIENLMYMERKEHLQYHNVKERGYPMKRKENGWNYKHIALPIDDNFLNDLKAIAAIRSCAVGELVVECILNYLKEDIELIRKIKESKSLKEKTNGI